MTQMKQELNKKVSLNISIGHLLILWNVISEKLAGDPVNKIFTEEEMRAIWALQDLCENKLNQNGINSLSETELEQLLGRAADYVRSIPVEFLD